MEIWSIGTALRNPYRIIGFLEVLNTLDGSRWNESCQLDYYIELIRRGEVNPNKITEAQLNGINQDEARRRMYQRYEDAPIRGRVLGSLFDKLGFTSLYSGNVTLTNRGIGLINQTISLGEAISEGLIEWNSSANHYRTQWQPFLNLNLPVGQPFSPFVATLYLIGRVNILSGRQDGISYREYNYYAKTVDHYGLIEAFANEIVTLRTNPNLQNTFRTIVDTKFDMYNIDDYTDNDIKYFSATGLIDGAGTSFANLNYNTNEILLVRQIIAQHIPNCLPI